MSRGRGVKYLTFTLGINSASLSCCTVQIQRLCRSLRSASTQRLPVSALGYMESQPWDTLFYSHLGELITGSVGYHSDTIRETY